MLLKKSQMHNTYTDNTSITDKRYRQNSNTKENTRLVPAFVGAGPCTLMVPCTWVVPCIWVIPSAVCAPNATHTQTHTH